MYNLIIFFYLTGVAIASLFNEKVRKMWRGEREAIKVLRSKVDSTAKYVWFHAASLGEFEQGRPIMEQLRREHPEYKILLTFFSPSGYEVRKDYEGADIVCYLPLDTPRNARRFLRTIRPVMAFFIKYEFWYNYLHILRHRGVPTYSVSSIFRKDQIFFRWYGKSYGHVLKCFTKFYVQNEESQRLLASIDINNVSVVGDTRFDRVLQIARDTTPPTGQTAQRIDAIEHFLGDSTADGKTKDVFVAGSSWQPDEEIFIPYFSHHKDWKMIIAPHVIGEDHLQQIEQLCKTNGIEVVRLSHLVEKPQDTTAKAIIIDCFGLLSTIYRYGKVSYVGGGFGVGIHNVLEAAVWQMPVIFGPNNKHFREAQALLACKGGHEITDATSFENIMNRFISDTPFLESCSAASAKYVEQTCGATDRILSDIEYC